MKVKNFPKRALSVLMSLLIIFSVFTIAITVSVQSAQARTGDAVVGSTTFSSTLYDYHYDSEMVGSSVLQGVAQSYTNEPYLQRSSLPRLPQQLHLQRSSLQKLPLQPRPLQLQSHLQLMSQLRKRLFPSLTFQKQATVTHVFLHQHLFYLQLQLACILKSVIA